MFSASETPRQIANAHTIFNVGLAATFLPFASLFARLCEWIVPDRPLAEEQALVPVTYLDDALIATPSLALERTRYEIGHMGEYVNEMLTKGIPMLLAGDREQIKEIVDIQLERVRRHLASRKIALEPGELLAAVVIAPVLLVLSAGIVQWARRRHHRPTEWVEIPGLGRILVTRE